MNNRELISVVVPVYNVEKYIKKCIDSILSQSYKNLEIYLVDDGSTDNSGKICDEYALNHDNIFVIHKENGGLSDARNVAIDQCKGEYITFIDSDDSVKEDYIEYLHSLLKNYDCDISICDFDYINENGELINHPLNTGTIEVLDTKKCIGYLLKSSKVNTSASMKMYRMSLFEGVRYPKGKLYEDIATTYKLILKAKMLVRGDRSLYVYLLRQGSITKQKFNLKKLEAIEHIDKMCADIIDVYPDLKELCASRIFAQYVTIYMQSTNTGCDKETEHMLFQKIKHVNNGYKYMSSKMKLYYIISRISKVVFSIATKFEYRIKFKSQNI